MRPVNPVGILRSGRTLSVMPTYACPAQCRDCGTVSSPRDRNHLSQATILESISQAAELGFANVVFTGGEATLRWPDLLPGIRHASSLGLPTRLVTNAHWATSKEEAASKTAELVDAGLDEINFSTGDEHLRFIPLDNVINAIVAALDRSLTLAIMVELRAERAVTQDTITNHPTIAALDSVAREKIRILESPWMPLKPQVIERYPEGTAVNRSNVASAGGCDSVLQTYVIQATGKIGACCGLGMRITPELNTGVAKGKNFLKDAIDDAESDILKLLLHYRGPERILEWASKKDESISWDGLYAHKCQACLRMYKDKRVRSIVMEHYLELVPSVLQAAWIEEELFPHIADTISDI